MAPVKEPRYFESVDHFAPFAPAPIRDQAAYLSLFQGVKNETAVGEASPSYLMDIETPKRICGLLPHARIIMLLRDPVEQVFSHYLTHVRMGVKKLTFHDAVKVDRYQRPAAYADAVNRYLDTFGARQVRILIFEEFIRDTQGAVQETLRFLGVEREAPPFDGEAHNAFALPRGRWSALITRNRTLRRSARALFSERFRRMVRDTILLKRIPKPPMPAESRRFLEDLYLEDVLKLEAILGRPLPWFHRKGALP
jgi:hypothetical protein